MAFNCVKQFVSLTQMRRLAATFLACVVLCASCSFGGAWPVRFGNPERLSSTTELVDPRVSMFWDIGYTTLALVSPVADAARVFTVVSIDGQSNGLVALDKWTGKLACEPFILPESFTYTVAIDDKFAYVSADKLFYCLQKNDLGVVWQQDINDEDIFSIVPGQSAQYGVTDQGTVFAVHKETGVFKWRYQLDPEYNYRWVTLGSGFVLVSGNAKGENISVVYCLYPNGERAWSLRLASDASVPPLVAGDLVIAYEIGKVFALDLKTGATVWSYPFMDEEKNPIAVDCAPAVMGKFVYVVSEGNLFRLSLEDGTQKEFVVIPSQALVKSLLVTPVSYFIVLDGDPFLLVYDDINNRFIKEFKGGRNVIGAAISGGIIIQSTVAITLLR